MNAWSCLGQGTALGLALAVPVGPIGVLCFRRALSEGWAMGVAVGLGAALADACYAAVAAWGGSGAAGFLLEHQRWLGTVGGLWLVALGVKAWRSVPVMKARVVAGGWGSAVVSTWGLTLTNPATVGLFLAWFTGWGEGWLGGAGAKGMLVGGVFAGSMAWWLVLSGVASGLGLRLGAGWLRGVNRVAGVVLVTFGLALVLRAGR